MSDLARAIHLVATDPDFRAALVDDPEAALAQQGFVVSAEELNALSSVSDVIAAPSEALLARLVGVTTGPEQLWQFRSRMQGDVGPETA
jgi:hypothetical protein